MDSEVDIAWPSEEVPEDATLYMRIHKGWWSKKKQRFSPDVFRDSGEGAQAGMSTNWSKYSSPEETRDQATRSPKENYVVAMKVSDILGIEGLSVKHTPLPGNRAHVDVIGNKSLEVTDALRRISLIVLQPEDGE